MTAMLASVRDGREAQLALEAGVDILDLKDPDAGALGALPEARVRAVMERIGGRCRCSATIGDVPFRAAAIRPRVEALAAAGVDFIKVGVFGDARDSEALGTLRDLAAGGRQLVLVLFAEDGLPASLLGLFAEHGVSGVMLDTRDKRSGPLRSKLSDVQLAAFVGAARDRGLFCGLAGSLRPGDIPPLLALQPDYLGFRGALCRGQDRGQRLDRQALAAVRRLVAGPAPATATA